MTVSINALEAIWLALCLITTTLTTGGWLDARRDLAAVKHLNGHIRGIVVRGNVRLQSLLLIAQGILFAIAFPSLFTDREATLTPGIVAVMALPVVLLTIAVFGARDRRAINAKSLLDLDAHRGAQVDRIESLANDTNERVIDIQEKS